MSNIMFFSIPAHGHTNPTIGVVADSVCFWGKLFAWKYGIPFVCSTTTFDFNRYSAKLMKQDFTEMFRMILGIPRIGGSMKKLRKAAVEIFEHSEYRMNAQKIREDFLR